MSEVEGTGEGQTVIVKDSVQETLNENSNEKNDDKESKDETDKKLPEISIQIVKPEPRKRTTKKSVSFESGPDEEVKKFIEGDVIVDKQNPFKNGTLFSRTGIGEEKIIVAKPRKSIKSQSGKSEEFVTTEDVLRESKYVTTYIKNPDKVFKYDPSIIARIKFEELQEIQGKKPQRKKTLTRQTQERLKELKSKYNLSSSNPHTKQSKTLISGESKIPKYRKVSKKNYPELSQIKVKIGTDLDETFQCNPEEVVLNAKRFDDRIKTLKIGSEDDLEDIEEALSSIEYSEAEAKTDQVDSSLKPEENKKSFTNTVNSQEFREYLKKKGLTLIPNEKQLNGSANIAQESQVKTASLETVSESMEGKKVRKPSVFQRLLHPSLFSSKRKTTPKDPIPSPQGLYSNSLGNSRPSSSIKRVVLERQSFHGAPTVKQSTSSNDMRKQIEQSRKSYGGDDRSSSISSALTNAEDFPDDRSVESIRQSDELLNRQAAKSRKPAALPQKVRERAIDVPGKPIPAVRSSIGRPPLVERKDVDENRNFRRSVSLDRQEIARRTQIPVKTTAAQRPMPNDSSNRSLSIPRSSRESYGPKMTSTPIQGPRPMRQPNTVPVIKPVPLSASHLNVSTEEWNRLRELKERTDMELYKRTNVQRMVAELHGTQKPPHEVIYETLPSAPQQQQQQQQAAKPLNRTVEQIRSPIVAINPNFVRGASYRNTFDGTTGSGGGGGGGYYEQATNSRTMNERLFKQSRSPQNFLTEKQQSEAQQPQRSQSVLDNMTMSHQQLYGSTDSGPVTMRRKPAVVLTKEEILNRVREFCRRSMNKTPTRSLDRATEMKTTAEISPVSYASVNYPQRNSGMQQIVAPQVPQRVHSLGQPSPPIGAMPQTPCTSPIYAHVMKRGSIQSNSSDMYSSPAHTVMRPGNRPLRNMDSAIMHSAKDFVIRNPSIAELDGANTEVQFRGRSGSEIYSGSPCIRLPPRAQLMPKTRATIDGRSTPLILMDPHTNFNPIYSNTAAQPQQPNYFTARTQQSPQTRLLPSLLDAPSMHIRVNNEQMYRPPPHSVHSLQRIVQHQQLPAQYSPRQRHLYESESGSEAGEVQRIMRNEEDWQNDKSGRNQSNEQVADDRRRANRREDPRRHTLGTDMLQYGSQGQSQQRAMDLEMGTRSQKSKKMPPIRGYTPISQGPLFDEDPGIMSEVETASTGFRRGGKQRSSLPVVRTPSKTLERPLGLVFLQYRSETKRALLPNEITSIDTVRALFVRSFPRQLTMAYLEGPNVKIYIHDASKDMFYELEDVRSHLREIRDRSVLRLFESNEVAAPQVLPGGPGVPQPLPQSGGGHWDQDQSYFSEPEFDSEYQHQHIHKSKGSKPAPYYVAATQTLPRSMYTDRNKNSIGAPAKPLRSYGSRGSMGPPFSYPSDQLYSIPDGYTSSPERGTRGGYEEPYYSQYGTRSTTVTPIIDEEQRCDGNLTDDQYSLYGMKVSGRIPRNPNQIYDPSRPEDLHRIRVEHMERQLANLTGLVQKALIQNPALVAPAGTINSNYLGIPGQCRGGLDDMDGHSSGSSTSIQDKSVSFEKSVSFSDDIQGVPKSHSPQHAERDRLKPPPPPKPIVLATAHQNYRPDIALAPEVYNHLRGLQKKAKDLRMEVRTLRRLSQAQAIAVREDIKDTFMRIRATLLASSGSYWSQGAGDQERTRLSREEELYKQEVIRLEKDLSDLETSVEELRGEVINRRTRVNMAAVEDMALVLSRASKTVAELKMKFPGLQQGLRNILANEMDKVVREEKFLKDEPDRLESALRRCKKLTGTLVTLKRLASVQEQRLPIVEPVTEEPPRSAEVSSANKPIPSPRLGTVSIGGGIAPENALDALLDELQTFAKPQSQIDMRPDESTTSDDSSQILPNTVTTQLSQSNLYPGNDPNALQVNVNAPNNIPGKGFVAATAGNLRRLHSYPSGSDTDTSPPQPSRPIGKPPVPERNAELLSKVGGKRIPPPPPPRTSSRSPLASPTSPNVPAQRLSSVSESEHMGNGSGSGQDGSGNSSGNESGNDHVQRQLALEMRHQELLKKQKMLQEQYARLQQMSKNSIALPPADVLQLKKTGSESNLPQKMGLNMATATGSMKNLNAEINVYERNEKNISLSNNTIIDSSNSLVSTGGTNNLNASTSGSTTNKVYETDIL